MLLEEVLPLTAVVGASLAWSNCLSFLSGILNGYQKTYNRRLTK